MSERSSDIEFDFFDEPETEEAAPGSRQARRGGPRPPVRPPAGFTPMLRLVGLIAFAILIVVLLVFWVQSCRAADKRESYENYMEEMRALARGSEQIGRELNSLLTTPGIKQAELEQQLSGLAQQQDQGVTQAREVTPPGPLRVQHRQAIEALQFRVSGLRRLEDAFRQTADSKDEGMAGQRLAEQAQRLLASDVIWEDLFLAPVTAELARQEITGVEVPDSMFLTNEDLASARQMTSVFRRIRGAATGGTPSGRHGNGLLSVKALPSGTVLEQDEENVVVATADLAFEVMLENSGDSQEVRVVVRLTVQQSPSPIVKTQTVDLINAGEQKTVVFRQLGQIVQFAQKTTVRVEIEPVPGEKNTANNSASYPVIFTLTAPS
jgi:type II secretory pathway component PulJ